MEGCPSVLSLAVAESILVDVSLSWHSSGLPYDPFHFPLVVKLVQSPPQYEPVGTRFPLLKSTLFGRKKSEECQCLRSETISRAHFSLSADYKLTDQGSRLGTFLWIGHQPMDLQTGDLLRVGGLLIEIQAISQTHIVLKVDGKTVFNTHPLFTIGSHNNCHFSQNGLLDFEACIDQSRRQIMNIVADEDASSSHGVWRKLRKGEIVQLELDSMFFVEPYVFALSV